MIAGTLAPTRPDAAAIMWGATEAYVVQPGTDTQRISSTVAAALGDERVTELRARGADMDWDQVVAYALAQATQALGELQPESQTWPWASPQVPSA
jgi:hypothetical protein